MEREIHHRIETGRVIQYLKDHEKREGGFSLVPELPSNIEDTYFATRTLKLLRRRMNRRNLTQYLKGMDWRQVQSPRTLFMLVYLHVTVHVPFPSPLISLLKEYSPALQNLDGPYYSDEIRKLLNQPLNRFSSFSAFQFQDNENLQALRKKISVWINHHVFFERDEIVQWVQSCQNGDGGFGFYPGTTSFMENTYCALEILSKLKETPLRIDACKEYILNCQTKSGGFGRAPMSFPFLESTFHAVSGWFLLRGMREKHLE